MALAGLLLGACGTISASSAMRNWVSQSGYHDTAAAILVDAEHAANAIRQPSVTVLQLHTVCGVLLYELGQANASLPTPDDQASTLLSNAYSQLGAGANQCYRARRVVALSSLTRGAASLSEARARIAAVSQP